MHFAADLTPLAGGSADALANAMIGHLVTLVQAGALQLLQKVTKSGYQVGWYSLGHHPVAAPTDVLHQSLMRRIDGEHGTAEVPPPLARDALTAGRHPHPDGKSCKGARNLDPVAQKSSAACWPPCVASALLQH